MDDWRDFKIEALLTWLAVFEQLLLPRSTFHRRAWRVGCCGQNGHRPALAVVTMAKCKAGNHSSAAPFRLLLRGSYIGSHRKMFPKPKPLLKPNTYAYESEPMVKTTGFREYDARWLFGSEINLMGVEALGLGLGTLIHELGVKRQLVTGHAFRAYSAA